MSPTIRLPVHQEHDACSYRVAERCGPACRHWLDLEQAQAGWSQRTELENTRGQIARRALTGEPTFATCCALDVANGGHHTLDEIAGVLGITRQRVDQIERVALSKVYIELRRRRVIGDMAEHAGGNPEPIINVDRRSRTARGARWATFELGGERKTAEGWAREFGLKGSTVRARIAKGMSLPRALGIEENAAQ
jgi:Sigma-70, region 4